MRRRPPRSTLSSSSAASDVYKRQYQRRVRGNQANMLGAMRCTVRCMSQVPSPMPLSTMDVLNQSALACAWAFPGRLDPTRLQAALSSVVTSYYPLLDGSVKLSADGIPEVYFTPEYNGTSKATRLVVVERSELAVEDVPAVALASKEPEFAPVLDARSVIQGDSPLLSVQLTNLSDGCVIGIGMSHLAADGAAYFQFVQHLAQAMNKPLLQLPQPDKPVLDRRLAVDVESATPDYRHRHPTAFTNRNLWDRCVFLFNVINLLRKGIDTHHFTLSPEKIKQLKATAMSNLPDGEWISSNDAVCADIWRRVCKFRGSASQGSTFGVAMQGRKLLGLADSYFGNAVLGFNHTMTVGSVLESSLSDLSLALKQARKEVNSDIAKDTVAWLNEHRTKSPLNPLAACLLYTSPSPRDRTRSRMPSSA
eukprot:TRINITY_DN50731_c0_g1_i2.p1 TRINITY_DN50731_c0_g1~~TRINITY_DN50731_c0_g1_i2.p1  ORF type:complete len:422 (-),score=83.95 TRINITY_DN50731_c0_g1_i2:51-1316(-)